ncbi:MAG: hypothetical protein JO044_14065 [Mycobacteriaceae bacterium]|nr:hypothetical protein [Mycobacteriaceae bacterium]MBV9639587.1 hypothetical protein [Mycobacteriaceae bacterium]
MPSRTSPAAGEPGSLADAEAEVARAEAVAAAARARAVELRRQAQGARTPAPAKRRRRLPRPSWEPVAYGAALLLIAALVGASGSMWWQHRLAVQQRQRTAEFAAAARRAVIDLMSIDFTTAPQGVQRVIDDSTGQLKNRYAASAQSVIQAIQDGKVVTKASVTAAGVESMSRGSAVVLVAARTERHNAQDPHDQAATWRMTVTLDEVGGRPKMSGVEFMR